MAAYNGLHRTLAVCMLLTLQACGGGGGGGYGGDSPPTQPAMSPPTISLVALPSSTVNRTITLTSDVTAAAGITRVEYLVDGTVIGTSTAAPYSFSWDTSTIADGAHAVTARVTDATNAVATSAPRNVTVANTPKIAITLSPTQTYPLPTSTANGTGELTFNLVSGAVSGGVTTSGIVATLAHIHRGYAGTAGPVIVNFVKSATDPNRWEPQAGSQLTEERQKGIQNTYATLVEALNR